MSRLFFVKHLVRTRMYIDEGYGQRVRARICGNTHNEVRGRGRVDGILLICRRYFVG